MRHFVQNNIQKPNKQLLYSVDNSKIKPSKQLQTMLSSALKGNGYDTLDDDQAYAIASIVQHATSNINSERRATIIIRGGPGTGKSVVAINALGRIISKYGLNACYVTKNSAPRVLFRKELISSNDRSLMNLFKSPVAFTRSGEMSYDCLIVDEAHRIVKMSNYPIYVEDSLNDIFKASRVNVFFIDEEQQVTTKDYCTIDLIKKYALK
jgi:superfamily II DNA or RNA helicase